MSQSHSHFSFESLILEAFKARDLKKVQWAEGLHHVVPHEHIAHISLHHQHAQYHLILFWIENLFSNAARWLGVRELARLCLDYIENTPFPSDDAVAHAEHFVETVSHKNGHLQVAQLEALMRCGLACWKVRSAAWRPDLAVIARDSSFSIKTLIEHGQMMCLESPGDWSVFDLWQSSESGRQDQTSQDKDVWVVSRSEEMKLVYEKWSTDKFQRLIGDQRE
jgi:hypothetical protein